MITGYQEILEFWFTETDPKLHFQKSLAFDQLIRQRFLQVYETAVRGETIGWRSTPKGRLAEIIVLDQFPRNMFRDSAKAFGSDALALRQALEAIECGADQDLSAEERSFMYMPLMHSEDPVIHEKAVTLFSQTGLEMNLKFEIMHKKIIDRFGRYPHRNKVLGRTSTPEEIEFLKTAGSSF
jgi:uncharacterized protein (DUF924 family)